jgi:hypothetical protein
MADGHCSSNVTFSRQDDVTHTCSEVRHGFVAMAVLLQGCKLAFTYAP